MLLDVAMSEKMLDHPDIDALLEQMGCKAVAQRMRRDALIEAGAAGGVAEGPLHGARGDWLERLRSNEQEPPVGRLRFQ